MYKGKVTEGKEIYVEEYYLKNKSNSRNRKLYGNNDSIKRILSLAESSNVNLKLIF